MANCKLFKVPELLYLIHRVDVTDRQSVEEEGHPQNPELPGLDDLARPQVLNVGIADPEMGTSAGFGCRGLLDAHLVEVVGPEGQRSVQIQVFFIFVFFIVVL